jgi:hypothetical protein
VINYKSSRVFHSPPITAPRFALKFLALLLSVFLLPAAAAPPQAAPQTLECPANSSTPFPLAATPADAPSLTFSVETAPAHGILSGTAPDLVYTPNPGFHGTDSFLFSVSDGTASSDPATVSLIVGKTFSGGTLASDTVLGPGPAPYGISEDLIVPENVTLTCLAGSVLEFQTGRQIRVRGILRVEGSASQRVQFVGAPGVSWGAISFEEPSGSSALRHFLVRNATRGISPPQSPDRYPAALSAFKATLLIEDMVLDSSQAPVSSRDGNLILRSSLIRCSLGTDFVSVKEGTALVENCTLNGSGKSDSDGVDFNGVVGGAILNNRFTDFKGNNSDAIDIGEASREIRIERNRIFFSEDKGVSIGQGSTVTLRHNLFAGCFMGVGIKDSGSFGTFDQNTFASCSIGIAIYEKNAGMGAGGAEIGHCVFGGSGVAPVTRDNLGNFSASYCLSDTLAIPGNRNLVAPVPFAAPQRLDFSLPASSAAHDAGNPSHAPDPDDSIADLGAGLVFDPLDYPLAIPVAISEISPNSQNGDWIELHNRSLSAVNISGWFLSDDKDLPQKYMIPAGITMEPDSYRVFNATQTFGNAFGLNPNGESVYLTNPTGERFKASYGPTPFAKSQGIRYAVPVVETDFVIQNRATLGAANSGSSPPDIVFAEILPRSKESGLRDEFIEIWNRSASAVTLADPALRKGWRITGGITHAFPSAPAVTIALGERIVLAKDPAAFRASFGARLPAGTRVFGWTQGSLSNSGDSLLLEKPASSTTYTPVDAVTFSNQFPQPVTSATHSLIRTVAPKFMNWSAEPASPGSLTLVSLTLTPPAVSTGKLSPFPIPTGLRPFGEKLALRAIPAAGHIFSHWETSGQPVLQNPLILFLTEPLDLSARIIPFPFTSGTFFGALSGNGTTGFWRVSLAASGALSGQILLNGRTLSFKGSMDARGDYALNLPRNAGRIILHQNLGTGVLDGSFTQGTLSATFTGPKLPTFTNASPCPLAGLHNVILRPEAPPLSPAPPFSTGYLSVAVSKLGACKVVGGLGDGTGVSFSVPLAAGNKISAGVLLPRRGGTLNGSLQFEQTVPETLSGTIRWQRSPDPNPALPWASGFSSLLTATGCRWTPPAAGLRIIPAVEAASGSASIRLTNPETTLSSALTFSIRHVAVENPVTDLKSAISASASTGAFSGTIHPPGTSSATRFSFRGVFLPVQGIGEGWVLNKLVPTAPLRVEIIPQTVP